MTMYSCKAVSEWLFFNATWTIFQQYHFDHTK